jgi:flavorubredoxin
MLHWPDSMFTYLNEDKILFSSDAFGQHYAGPKNSTTRSATGSCRMPRNIMPISLLLYAAKTLKLLEKVTDMGLEFNMICPDHGVLWRKDIAKIIDAYVRWSKQEPANKALVVYDTMWHSTAADGRSHHGRSGRGRGLRHPHGPAAPIAVIS